MKTYTTVQGDTWDGIAFRLLGSEKFMPQLMRVNPSHISTVIFSAGVALQIPIIAPAMSESLPPWKRGG